MNICIIVSKSRIEIDDLAKWQIAQWQQVQKLICRKGILAAIVFSHLMMSVA